MPVIKEEDLLGLYSELEKLKGDNERLQTGYVNLKLKTNKVEKQKKVNRIIFILAIIAFLISLFFLYYNYTKSQSFKKETQSIIKKTQDRQLVLLDSIQKLSSLTPNKNNANVIYSIQLGIFKNLDVEIQKNENLNFKEIETENGRVYQIGTFLTYKTATAFKEEIKKIGLNDAFLVPYNKNKERIDIKQALALSNEEEYIKD